MADNPITVPLPQDLPQNWTYGQTIGPQGTDVGLTQQHGYNYLMQQVNAAQQAAQELGAAFSGLYGEGDVVSVAGGGTGATTTQQALANLGAGVRPNLGDNCDFTQPINQRGETSWDGTSNDVPIFDRWKLQGDTSAISAQLINTGLQISMNGINQGLKQYYPSGYLPDGEYTSSAVVNGKLLTAKITVTNQEGVSVSYPDSEYSCAIIYEPSRGVCAWYPIVNYGTTAKTVVVSKVKLENGQRQTLGYWDAEGNLETFPQQEKDYLLRLLKCQAYGLFFGSETEYVPLGVAHAVSETTIMLIIPTPVTMRATPVVSLSGEITFRINSATYLTADVASVDVLGPNCVLLNATVDSATPGAFCDAYMQPGDSLYLNAEL